MTAAAPAAALVSPVLDGPVGPRVGFARLVRVEIRKLTDTRGGIGLLVAIGLLGVGGVVLAFCTGNPADLGFLTFTAAAGFPQALLLPVLGILTVTGEWTERTTVVTFVIEPRRGRVAGAKLVAALTFALAAIGVALALGATGSLLATALRGADGGRDVDPGLVLGATALQLLGVLQGLAFGLAILRTTQAIIAYFVLPVVWMVLGAAIPALATAAHWLDLASATTPLLAGTMTAADWPPLATSMVLWIGVPLAIGYLRWTRREVS